MPADLFRRIDLDELFPPFRDVLLEVIARCRARGADYVATSGYRSESAQAELHARYRRGEGGRAAPAGYSAHNFGIAVDFVRDGDPHRPGVQPRWDLPAYEILGQEVGRAGLAWGGSFGDAPHVQWPGFVRASELEQLRAGDLGDAWALLARLLDSTWRKGHPRLSAELERLGY